MGRAGEDLSISFRVLGTGYAEPRTMKAGSANVAKPTATSDCVRCRQAATIAGRRVILSISFSVSCWPSLHYGRTSIQHVASVGPTWRASAKRVPGCLCNLAISPQSHWKGVHPPRGHNLLWNDECSFGTSGSITGSARTIGLSRTMQLMICVRKSAIIGARTMSNSSRHSSKTDCRTQAIRRIRSRRGRKAAVPLAPIVPWPWSVRQGSAATRRARAVRSSA